MAATEYGLIDSNSKQLLYIGSATVTRTIATAPSRRTLATIMEKRYKIAMEEFENSDDDAKARLVYAYFGLAIYYGQCIEETFTIMLWTDKVFKNKAKTNKEVNDIIDTIENSKKTMGLLINEVKQSYNLTASIVEELRKLLEMRNYLAHKYFKLHISKCYSEVGKLEMIKYFCDFVDKSKELDEQLKDYYSSNTHTMGITEERIEQLMVEMRIEELKRVDALR